MRKVSVLKKIKGGKTVKVDLEFDEGGRIHNIIISGDFFVYPQEMLEALENELKGCKVNEVREVIEKYSTKMTVLGFTLEDVIELIEKAFKV